MDTKKSLPKVNCRLVGKDGNAFFIMGRFQGAARKAGWKAEDIEEVMQEAMNGDYAHLIRTIAQHCKNP